MWKRICAYIVGILLALYGIAYALDWYTLRPARLEARKTLAELEARENALVLLGDIELDPTDLTFANLEEILGPPDLTSGEVQNTTKAGWACAGKDCEVWASFLTSPGQQILPAQVPATFIVREFRKSAHRISVAGVYLGESVENVKQFCRENGFESEGHEIIFDKHWKIMYGEWGNRVIRLLLVNQDALRNHLSKKSPTPLKNR